MKRILTILTALLALAACLAAEREDRRPTYDAVLLSSFDRADASDKTPYARSPTSGSAPVFSSRSLSLDGTDDYVYYASASELNAYPLTVVVWFNLNNQDQAQYASLVDKYSTGSANGWQVWVDTGENIHAWYFGGSAANCIYGGGDGTLLTSAGYKAAGWTHLAVVFAGGGGEIYINGASVDTQGWTGTPTSGTSTHRLAIGQHNFSGGRYYKGYLDDLRIYARALTAAEILADYSHTLNDPRL